VAADANDPFSPGKGNRAVGESDRSRVGLYVGIAVAIAAAVIFVTQNRDRTEFNFLFVDTNTRTWVLILISFVLGGVVGMLGSSARRRRKKD